MNKVGFTTYADNFITTKTTSNQHSTNPNINVVINNTNTNKTTQNVNINHDILVINKFPNKANQQSSTDKPVTPLYDIEDLNSPKKRVDRRGNEINRNNKRFHVTFIDKITKKRLVNVVDIESYKAYNLEENIPPNHNNQNSCCSLY